MYILIEILLKFISKLFTKILTQLFWDPIIEKRGIVNNKTYRSIHQHWRALTSWYLIFSLQPRNDKLREAIAYKERSEILPGGEGPDKNISGAGF